MDPMQPIWAFIRPNFPIRLIREETDGELFWKITVGKKPMPNYGSRLSPTDRWNVINYLRSLARGNAKVKIPSLLSGSDYSSSPANNASRLCAPGHDNRRICYQKRI